MLPGFRREQLDRIGFTYVLDRCEPLTPYGREQKKAVALYPAGELAALKRELDAVGRLLAWCRLNGLWVEDIRLILERFKEIRGTLGRLGEEGRVLDEVDLFELKNFAINVGDLRPLIAACAGSAMEIGIPDVSAVVRSLNPDPPVTRSFFLSGSYSADLASIRERKQKIEKDLFGSSGSEAGDRTDLMRQRRELAIRERQAE
ncbi:MAG TPA: hypothetical protein PKM25_09690, partial [Candidatus Ozemobacteraceae bacterium]|nr:hypothetical protein [Candidatus Ozemobacteraceae bacterium]